MVFSSCTRRRVAAGALAIAALAPGAAVLAHLPAGPPAYSAACPAGEDPDEFTTTCVPYLVPNTGGRRVGAATPSAVDLCPPGVSGAECMPQESAPAAPPQPQLPAPVEGQSPLGPLLDVSTPDV